MPTHAEIAGKLLEDASVLFRTLGNQNEHLKEQMFENAELFSKLGRVVGHDPQGDREGTSNADLAGHLLQEAAGFFRSLGEHNEPIREQMQENARVYDQLGTKVQEDPLGLVD